MLQNLKNKARDLLRGHKDDIDKGLDKAEQTVSDRTGGKYDEHIDTMRQKADDALGEDEQAAPGNEDAPRGDRPDDRPDDTRL